MSGVAWVANFQFCLFLFHYFSFPFSKLTLSLWLEKDELQAEITNISSQEMALDREIRNLNTAITELADTTISGLNKKKAQALAGTQALLLCFLFCFVFRLLCAFS
jgi:hypothetical protein